MKSLEKKIIKEVFIYETKRTFFELLLKIGMMITLVIVGIAIIMSIIQQLFEQQTLDLFELFHEDTETIKMYFGDVMHTLYEEWPKFETVLIITLSVVLILLALYFIKNYAKIRNKLTAIYKFWFHH